jgi:NitT/TauT family transport system permease protein
MKQPSSSSFLYVVFAALGFVGVWWIFTRGESGVSSAIVPTPEAVFSAYGEEFRGGRLLRDTFVSIVRVAAGFSISVALAVPIGTFFGASIRLRAVSAPFLNFFRNLSPIAWIPFAVLWFGIGNPPVVFLLVVATFFSIALGAGAAVQGIPPIYLQMSREDGLGRGATLVRTIFPAILPELLTVLRLSMGLAWSVVVAAEMLAGREGLGFAIMDARNGLRNDLLVANMIQIGAIGVLLDFLFVRLLRGKRVRWKYGR